MGKWLNGAREVRAAMDAAEPQLVFDYTAVPEQGAERSGRYGGSPCAAGRNAGGR